jgi:Carbohydrate family 9 binding domain-like
MARADTVTFAGKPLAGHPRRATVYALWDKENLYLAFDVRSSKLQASVRERDGDQLWEDDGVEFLIDALSDRAKGFLPDDFSYHINILNAVYDDRGTPSGQADPVWNGNAQHLARILDDYHYVVQVSIPWAEIGIVPAEGIPLLASISA